MKGRGTRTVDHDDLKKVSPSALSGKTHYVIVDAVGVTSSLKTASQPLISKAFVCRLRDLAMGVMMGVSVMKTRLVHSLVAWPRLNQQLDPFRAGHVSETQGRWRRIDRHQLAICWHAIDADRHSKQRPDEIAARRQKMPSRQPAAREKARERFGSVRLPAYSTGS